MPPTAPGASPPRPLALLLALTVQSAIGGLMPLALADGPSRSRLDAALVRALPRLEAAVRTGGCATPPNGLPARLRVDAACRVQAAVVARRDPDGLASRIRNGGGRVTRVSGDPPTLQVWAPPALLRALADDEAVAAVRLPRYARSLGPSPTPLP